MEFFRRMTEKNLTGNLKAKENIKYKMNLIPTSVTKIWISYFVIMTILISQFIKFKSLETSSIGIQSNQLRWLFSECASEKVETSPNRNAPVPNQVKPRTIHADYQRRKSVNHKANLIIVSISTSDEPSIEKELNLPESEVNFWQRWLQNMAKSV